MRLIVNIVDSTIVVDGIGRQATVPATDKLLAVSWDGTTGIKVYEGRDPVYFEDETEIGPYLSAWEDAPEPAPPPLPPWEDEPELPLDLPKNAIPTVLAEPEEPLPVPVYTPPPPPPPIEENP